MAKKKELIVRCSGTKHVPYGGSYNVSKCYNFHVTGSRLSIRKCEAFAVHEFLKEHNLGGCSLDSLLN